MAKRSTRRSGAGGPPRSSAPSGQSFAKPPARRTAAAPSGSRPLADRAERPAGPPSGGGWVVGVLAALLVVALVVRWRQASAPPPRPAPAESAASEAPRPAAPSPAPPSPSPPPPSRPSGDAEQIRASHILVMYRGSMRAPATITRTQPEARTRAEQALRRARAGEDFAALAREYSDEPGAGARGGDLNRFGRGMMVPAFEQAAFALRVGQISELVETPFGYHVIKRTE